MTDTKHTPGPWEVVKTKEFPWHGETGENPFDIDGVDADGCGFRPCKINGNGFDNPGVALANAHLIAAAPDLLEALKYVVKYHRDNDSGDGELFSLDYVTTCIAAIAKAKGEQ